MMISVFERLVSLLVLKHMPDIFSARYKSMINRMR